MRWKKRSYGGQVKLQGLRLAFVSVLVCKFCTSEAAWLPPLMQANAGELGCNFCSKPERMDINDVLLPRYLKAAMSKMELVDDTVNLVLLMIFEK